MNKWMKMSLCALIFQALLVQGCATSGTRLSDGDGPAGSRAFPPTGRTVSGDPSPVPDGDRPLEILRAMERIRNLIVSDAVWDQRTMGEDVNNLVDDLPSHPYPWLLRGLTLRRSGELPAAKDALLRALELDPELVSAYLYLGIIAGEQGDVADAEFFLGQAWNNLGDRDAARYLAYLKLLMGQPDSARELLHSIPADNPGDAGSINNLALAFTLTGMDREALELLDRVHDELHGQALLETRALVELREGRIDLAAEDLEERLSLAPPDPDTILLLGILNLQRGNLEAAEESFREVIAVSPSEPAGYVNLGLTLRRMGRFKDAERQYLAGIEAADHPDIHLNLGVLYELYLDAPGKALEHYRMFNEKHGGGSQRVLGWINYLAGIAGNGE